MPQEGAGGGPGEQPSQQAALSGEVEEPQAGEHGEDALSGRKEHDDAQEEEAGAEEVAGQEGEPLARACAAPAVGEGDLGLDEVIGGEAGDDGGGGDGAGEGQDRRGRREAEEERGPGGGKDQRRMASSRAARNWL